MMRADVDRHRAEIVQLRSSLLAVLHGGVVRLVVAEPAIDRLVRARRFWQIDLIETGCLCRAAWSAQRHRAGQ